MSFDAAVHASWLAALPEPALLLDPAGKVAGANALARRLLGVQRREGLPPAPDAVPAPARALEGRPLAAVVSLDSSSSKQLPEIARLSMLRNLEGEIEPEDGAGGPLGVRRVAVSLGALPGPERSPPGAGGYVAILRDVTDERRREQVRLTEEKLAAIAQLAAGVAHEFNNIMASLYGFAQLAGGDPAFNDELIGAVQQYAERSREITRRLRSFSPEPSGPLEAISIAEVCDQVLEKLATEMAQADVRVERRYEPVPETLVSRRELEEAIETLLTNARHAIVKSGTIGVEIASVERTIEVRISDTGYGIPKEHLTRVFEPFFTLKQTSDVVRPGAGLGLAVAYNYVRRLGGEVFAESEIGKGTRFTVRIPIRAERRRREGAAAGVATERRRLGGSANARSILAVDDEESMVRLLESILGADHRVVTARSGREAVAAISKKGPFDYVILDLVIPGELDGYAVFDEIMKRDKTAKVILLTGLIEDEKVKDYAARAYGYLRKPFGIKDLATLIV